MVCNKRIGSHRCLRTRNDEPVTSVLEVPLRQGAENLTHSGKQTQVTVAIVPPPVKTCACPKTTSSEADMISKGCVLHDNHCPLQWTWHCGSQMTSVSGGANDTLHKWVRISGQRGGVAMRTGTISWIGDERRGCSRAVSLRETTGGVNGFVGTWRAVSDKPMMYSTFISPLHKRLKLPCLS